MASSINSTMSAPSGHSSPTFDVDVFKFRVGAPAPIPGQAPQKEDVPAGEESSTTTSKEAVSIAAEVLSKHGIVFQDIRFSSRGSPEESTVPRPRVLIVAPWHDDSYEKWSGAVREIKERIDGGAHGLGASVEIIAPQVGRGKELGAIIDKPELERDWDEILEGVFHTRVPRRNEGDDELIGDIPAGLLDKSQREPYYRVYIDG